MRPDRPPRLASGLLSALLPRRTREALVGDLREEWSRRRAAGTPARLWYWRQAIAIAMSYRFHRSDPTAAIRRGLHALAGDLRAALLHVRRDRRFSTMVVLLLAAGVAIATVCFTLVYSLLLSPLPFPAPDRLVALHETHAASGVAAGPVAPGNFLDWNERLDAFEAMAAYYTSEAALTGNEPVESILVGEVTADFFEVLGTPLLLGRGFDDADTAGAWLDNAGRFRGPARVVLHESLWRFRFGADPNIVGRSIAINGQPTEVIGVAPASVTLPSARVQAWVAWDMVAGAGSGGGAPSRNSRFVDVIGRLAPDSPAADAERELSLLANTLALAYPSTNGGWSATLRPLAEVVTAGATRPLGLLMAAMALLLLGVATSLIALQASRIESRRGELAVRAALGAARVRRFRQLLIENLLLATAAGFMGWFVGRNALNQVVERMGIALPRPLGEAPTGAVLTVALAVAIATGLAAGLVAASRASRVGPLAIRGTGNAGRWLTDRKLVVGEIALAVVLVSLTALLAHSYVRLIGEDPGFDASGVLTARVNLEAGVSSSASGRVGFFEELLEQLQAEADVLDAGRPPSCR